MNLYLNISIIFTHTLSKILTTHSTNVIEQIHVYSGVQMPREGWDKSPPPKTKKNPVWIWLEWKIYACIIIYQLLVMMESQVGTYILLNSQTKSDVCNFYWIRIIFNTLFSICLIV